MTHSAITRDSHRASGRFGRTGGRTWAAVGGTASERLDSLLKTFRTGSQCHIRSERASELGVGTRSSRRAKSCRDGVERTLKQITEVTKQGERAMETERERQRERERERERQTDRDRDRERYRERERDRERECDSYPQLLCSRRTVPPPLGGLQERHLDATTRVIPSAQKPYNLKTTKESTQSPNRYAVVLYELLAKLPNLADSKTSC